MVIVCFIDWAIEPTQVVKPNIKQYVISKHNAKYKTNTPFPIYFSCQETETRFYANKHGTYVQIQIHREKVGMYTVKILSDTSISKVSIAIRKIRFFLKMRAKQDNFEISFSILKSF